MIKPFDRIHPYNDLPLLPPPQSILNDTEILLKLVKASRVLGELNGNIQRLPNPQMLVNTISLQEAKTSSAIENIFTTNDELFKAETDVKREESASPAIKEILRYREALWKGYELSSKTGYLDKISAIQIFQKVKNTTVGIRPPQSGTVIKKGNSELDAGSVVYTPPRGEGIIEEKLENLFNFLYDDSIDVDPLLKMAIGHYQFEAIHPFTDGNGRTGRIINLIYLVNKGLLPLPVLYLSKYIIQNKSDYYYHLQSVTTRKDWKSWILYMLTAVEQTARHTNYLVSDIVNQMASTLEYGKSKLKWYNKEINEVLYSQPYIKPSMVGDVLGKQSAPTIRKYMKEMLDVKLISHKKEWKDAFYVNDDLFNLLSSD